MRLGSLEKKVLLMLLKKGASTVKELGFEGVDRNSMYRALRGLREKGFVVRKLRCAVGFEYYRDFDFWKRQLPHTRFFVVKTKEEGGGYFHLYGLTLQGKDKAVELRNELLDFKREWEGFL